MKKFIRAILLFSAISFIFKSHALGQKRPIQISDLKQVATESVSDGKVSPDGNYVFWKEDRFLVQSADGKWKSNIFDARNISFTDDSKKIIFQTGKDSLCLLTLGSQEREYIKQVNSYKLSSQKDEWLAYSRNDKIVTLRELSSGQKIIYDSVLNFDFNRQGTALVITQSFTSSTVQRRSVNWIDLRSGKSIEIWISEKAERTFTQFRKDGNLLLISSTETDDEFRSLWVFKESMERAIIRLDAAALDKSFSIEPNSFETSMDSRWIFFSIKRPKKEEPKLNNGAQVDVYSYTDPKLQVTQLAQLNNEQTYQACIPATGDEIRTPAQVVVFEQPGERALVYSWEINGDYTLILNQKGGAGESWWNSNSMPAIYLVSLKDGSRKLLKNYQPHQGSINYSFSPGGKYVIFFDNIGVEKSTLQWYSYEVATGKTRCISKSINTSLSAYKEYEFPSGRYNTYDIAGWTEKDKDVLIADRYDIWKVSLDGTVPAVNLTEAVGIKNKIKFKIIKEDSRVFATGDTIYFTSFNQLTKDDGFYRKILTKEGAMELLTSGSFAYYGTNEASQFRPVKAKYTDAWLLFRQSCSESPNYFYTNGWKNISRLTNVQPQKNYNWLTSELVNWKTKDGKFSQGVLYKPEDFDSTKKYPVILYYYEKESDKKNIFPKVYLPGDNMNIPFYVSNGYLVFTPDIHYSIGNIGYNALNHVVSAAQFLMQRKYVDSKHMGLMGHSHGGFETNFIVTHTDIFSGAVAAAGMTDLVSDYGSWTHSISRQGDYEIGSTNMGASLWEQPEKYIGNSPIFSAHRVVTPLLMMHNKLDENVPWQQGMEFFTALRRLGKRVWMLQYDRGEHWVLEEQDMRDYNIRMKQFFDHYLRGTPPPKWMTEGIPANRKGIDNGYELDTSGKAPQERPVLFDGKIQLVRDALKRKGKEK